MTKEKAFKKIIDAITGEEIIIDLTDAEIAEIAALEANELAIQNAKKEAATAKAALLSRLGITEDEAKLLLS